VTCAAGFPRVSAVLKSCCSLPCCKSLSFNSFSLLADAVTRLHAMQPVTLSAEIDCPPISPFAVPPVLLALQGGFGHPSSTNAAVLAADALPRASYLHGLDALDANLMQVWSWGMHIDRSRVHMLACTLRVDINQSWPREQEPERECDARCVLLRYMFTTIVLRFGH